MANKGSPIFAFDESSDLPLWVQLRDRLAFLIDSGVYLPGEKMPTVRGLAADLCIAYNTVNKAYMGLERNGYVTTIRGSGVFVNAVGEHPEGSSRIEEIVEEFVSGCLEEGVAYEDMPKLISQYVRRMGKH